MPKPFNKAFQKFPINFASLSQISILGTPCNLKISFIKISAILIALYVDFNGIKWDALLSLATTTMIESFCLTILGNPIMKSILIISISILE